jgi:hypothetical protein
MPRAFLQLISPVSSRLNRPVQVDDDAKSELEGEGNVTRVISRVTIVTNSIPAVSKSILNLLAKRMVIGQVKLRIIGQVK